MARDPIADGRIIGWFDGRSELGPRGKAAGNPPTCKALRTATETYVEYANGDHEYYDRTSDPNELTNAYSTLSAQRRAQLHTTLRGLGDCHGTKECTKAAHVAR